MVLLLQFIWPLWIIHHWFHYHSYYFNLLHHSTKKCSNLLLCCVVPIPATSSKSSEPYSGKLCYNNYESTIVSIADAVIKYFDKINLQKKGFISAHSSSKQSIMLGKPQWQECWVSHLIALAWPLGIIDIDENLLLSSPSPLTQPRVIAKGWCHPQ